MGKFNPQSAVAALELQQLVIDYWREVDFNEGRNGSAFFTDDCEIELGGTRYQGHGGLEDFFALRQALNRKEKDGIRTTRHCPQNLQITVNTPTTATIKYLVVAYGGGGKPPVSGHLTPTLISDACFKCRRDNDRPWRIAGFSGSVVFV